MTKPTADNSKPYRLYRYFDAEDRLLYVGMTGDLAVRDKAHIASSRWMQLTARSTVEPYETLADISSAEREAIRTEHPLFNQRDSNIMYARVRLRAYLEKIGRLDLLSSPKASANRPGPKPPQAETISEHPWFRNEMLARGYVEGPLGRWSRSVQDIPLSDRAGMGGFWLLGWEPGSD